MPTYSEELLGIGSYKVQVATPNQKRTIEFGQHLKGKDINSLLIAITGPKGKRKLFGLKCSKISSTQVRVTSGVCIKDFVVIRILEDVTVTIPPLDGSYYLVLRYRYQESLPTDDADILFVTPTTYSLNPSLYLYLATVMVQDSIITSLGYDPTLEPLDIEYTSVGEQPRLVTTQPITLYVDSERGNDTLGDGSSENPFRTLNAAYLSLPLIICHPITIILKQSTTIYDSTTLPNLVLGSESAYIEIRGEEVRIANSTISSYSEDPNTSLCTINTGSSTPPTVPTWLRAKDEDRVVLYGGSTCNVVVFENIPNITIGDSCRTYILGATIDQIKISNYDIPIRIRSLACTSLQIDYSICEVWTSSIQSLNTTYSTIYINRCKCVNNVVSNHSNVECVGSYLTNITLNNTTLKVKATRITGTGIECKNRSTLVFDTGWKSSFDVIDKTIVVKENSCVLSSENTVNILPFELIDGTWDTSTRIPKLKIGGSTHSLPVSTLSIGGSIDGYTRVVNGNSTIGNSDFVVFANCTNTPITLSLPPATTGRLYIVKKIDNTENICTLLPTSGQTIAGEESYNISSYSVGVILIGTNVGWEVLSTGDIIENLDNLYYRKIYLYTKTELQTPGAAVIDWRNIVNAVVDGGTW